ncbi:MAG: hypothetical protein E6K77_07195 [Candidatus Eisenbacteria bacterium]|uniref:Uncharacterized protein n=1 Tax=Eiseniibacteriota bacterium TaxID=2212470 RepID=A0A538TFX4_UNCEI|nr:MAG: hypothetical protein E6K77_07195 [Candidatus Eisenbacteria bacterium]
MSLPFRPLSFLALFAVWAGVACGEAPAISPRIESVTETGYRAVVSIPVPDIKTGQIFGENLAEISPLGGAHRDPEEMAHRIQSAIVRHVRGLLTLPAQELLDRRLEKFLKMGVYLEETGPIPAPAGEG